MNQTVAPRDKLASLIKDAHNLEGRRSLLIEQKAQILIDLQNASHYLDHKDEVQAFLMEIQTEAQEKTKKMFEDLLTSLIREVRPDNRDQIIFDTQIKNNKVALDINVKIDERSRPLNVLKDKGGSIQNITAMGLRFITVSRSRNRKIVLLDEADHWLPVAHVPTFAKIVRQLSEELGIQVIYISHHKPEAFIGQARIIKLALKNQHIQAIDDEPTNFQEDDIGIRSIRLRNFKKHTNTQINFDKYVTVITGAGDLGKSAIIEAFHTVMHNDGRDELIKDESDRCNIEIGIEDGKFITYQYLAKGNNRTKYQVVDDAGKPIEKSTDGRNKPVWLDSYLACPTLGDIDIHTGTQRASNFILDDKFSPQRRAEILSLENEAEQIQQMITLHAEKITYHRRNVTTLNKQLNDTKNALSEMDLLPKVFEALERANAHAKKQDSLEKQINAIKEAGADLSKAIQRRNILAEVGKIDLEKDVSQLEDLKYLKSEIVQLAKAEHIKTVLSTIKNVDEKPTVPLVDVQTLTAECMALSRSIKRRDALRPIESVIEREWKLHDLTGFTVINELESLTNKVNVLAQVRSVDLTLTKNLNDTNELYEHTSKLNGASGALVALRLSCSNAAQEASRLENMVAAEEKKLGHCPLCSTAFKHEEECAHG
ncbi:AAA family ATPase [Pseudomonas syringae pv. actinidiae]|nr:AAA family ATPase [Pseudomonas syringae pv. actinidiae]